MAALGFLLTHLKYVRGLHLKGQFITGTAETLTDSESLSHAMEDERCLKWLPGGHSQLVYLRLIHYTIPRGENIYFGHEYCCKI